MNPLPNLSHALRTVAAGFVAFMAGCTSTTTQPPTRLPDGPPPAAKQPTGPAPVVTVSRATTPRDYRRDAASHLYAKNTHRIYQGKLPPMLYAIGVLQVDLNGKGQVMKLNWMRAPKHAPEVIKEIERTVREAAPYPIPARMGRVTYTDTWLWHKSGLFQLDTLTEGQD